MEAFSYDDKQYRPYLLDSSFMFLPNTNTNNHDHNHNVTNMSCFLERSTDNNSYNSCFSPHDQHHPFYNQPDRTVDVLSSVNTSSGSTTSTTKLSICSNNSSSSALTQLINPMDKRKNIFQQPQSKVKGKKQKKETVSIDCMNMKLEKKVMSCKKKRRSDDKKKNYEESSDQRNDEAAAPSGYIYVRARRGQATDSHSLAERVRREKISQRMKLLQALVPGCHKVMGKANMLDEIISYVQSLQNQVELLSLKIACLDPTLYDNGMNLLDSLIYKPEVLNQNQLQRNIRLEATDQPNVLQQQNHTHITNTNICNTSGYSHMDNSTLLQHQQAQISNSMSLPQWKTLVSSPHTHVSPGTDLENLFMLEARADPGYFIPELD